MDARLQAVFEKTWRDTTRVLFGKELAGLEKYDEWLSGYLLPTASRKSRVSGREVILAKDAYLPSAKFISEDELKADREYAVSINDMKDMDSLVRALAEKAEYSGNRFLGNSSFVESSDVVLDSQYVSNSTNIEQSSYIYKSYMMRRASKCVFGSGYTAAGEHLIRVVGGINLHRCFESHVVTDSSDLYFSFNCEGVHEALFSFGQKNRKYLIGNLQLPKDKYRRLKAKLLGEVVDKLESEGSYPSLYSLCPEKLPALLPKVSAKRPDVGMDMAPIEKGFANTYSILFKRTPPSITKLEKWLARNTCDVEAVKTAFGSETSIAKDFGMLSEIPRKRAVTVFESLELGKIALDESGLGSVESIKRGLGQIAYFTSEYWSGENRNIFYSPIVLHSTNIYKGFEATYSENTSHTFMSLHSKFVYGCGRIIDSQFCMKCYDSVYLNRCFELDSCIKCSDSYFCHNCEGLQECMFCFNTKGKRHCIGNTQLSKGDYVKIRDLLVGQMAGEIARTNSLGLNIYSIGAKT
ncbi:MAG: hypothetical protein WC506_02290 [Candidatus Micrarchaeia archaeon]